MPTLAQRLAADPRFVREVQGCPPKTPPLSFNTIQLLYACHDPSVLRTAYNLVQEFPMPQEEANLNTDFIPPAVETFAEPQEEDIEEEPAEVSPWLLEELQAATRQGLSEIEGDWTGTPWDAPAAESTALTTRATHTTPVVLVEGYAILTEEEVHDKVFDVKQIIHDAETRIGDELQALKAHDNFKKRLNKEGQPYKNWGEFCSAEFGLNRVETLRRIEEAQASKAVPLNAQKLFNKGATLRALAAVPGIENQRRVVAEILRDIKKPDNEKTFQEKKFGPQVNAPRVADKIAELFPDADLPKECNNIVTKRKASRSTYATSATPFVTASKAEQHIHFAKESQHNSTESSQKNELSTQNGVDLDATAGILTLSRYKHELQDLLDRVKAVEACGNEAALRIALSQFKQHLCVYLANAS